MKKTDKFLIGIVAGVGLLAIVSFVIVALRVDATYQPEDTPEGVAYNYLLALQQEDYARAYGYLSPGLPRYPVSASLFEIQIKNNYRFSRSLDGSTTLTIESTSMFLLENRAFISVNETIFYQRDLFNSGQYTRSFDMTLEMIEGEWKIIDADAYFWGCWNDTSYRCD